MNFKQSLKLRSFARLGILLVIVLLLNIISQRIFTRIDLTTEKRYTLAKATTNLLRNLDDVVYVQVYLEGKFPAGFKRLRNAAEEMLYEFSNVSGGKVQYRFLDPSQGAEADRQLLYKDLYDKGLMPTNLQVKEADGTSQQIIFPGLLMRYRGQEVPVNLLENRPGFGPEQALNVSIELLEYKIANGVKKVSQRSSPRIGILQGHGELDKKYLADIITNLTDLKYDVKLVDLPTTLSVAKSFETLIIPKPTQPFLEQDKFKLDQFVMHGGSILWLIDVTDADMDSLRGKPFHMAATRQLNLDDQLFKYGVRLNGDLVQDMQSNVIPIVVGEGNPPQTQLLPWPYFPVLTSYTDDPNDVRLPKPHTIVRNLDAIAAQFISTIDTIRVPGVKKTPLLFTSRNSKAVLAPARLHFAILKEQPNPQNYNKAYMPVAYLLEGNFPSLFKNRLSAETIKTLNDSLQNVGFKDASVYAKMIVIADGDIIANQVASDGNPYLLGYYPFTKQTFANKDFILNCIEYLTDDAQLIETRNKEIKLRLLDKQRVRDHKLTWQVVNMAVPVLLVALFGLVYNFIRRRKYARN
ncbi:gliding motility-associated ABC transporter substrate-binding protein GldG [soil metagenome]